MQQFILRATAPVRTARAEQRDHESRSSRQTPLVASRVLVAPGSRHGTVTTTTRFSCTTVGFHRGPR